MATELFEFFIFYNNIDLVYKMYIIVSSWTSNSYDIVLCLQSMRTVSVTVSTRKLYCQVLHRNAIFRWYLYVVQHAQ